MPDVLVVAEQLGGTLKKASLSAVKAGRELAQKAGELDKLSQTARTAGVTFARLFMQPKVTKSLANAGGATQSGASAGGL